MASMQVPFSEQNYVRSEAVSCRRTTGVILPGIFNWCLRLTPTPTLSIVCMHDLTNHAIAYYLNLFINTATEYRSVFPQIKNHIQNNFLLIFQIFLHWYKTHIDDTHQISSHLQNHLLILKPDILA